MKKIAKFALAATLVGGVGAPTAVFVADQADAGGNVCIKTAFPLKSWEAYTSGGAHNGSNATDRRNIKRIQYKVGTKADGIYGPNTSRKVAAWQKNHGLRADGRVGAKTWASMNFKSCGLA